MTDRDQTELDAMTLYGGWKLLCVATLHQAVHNVVQERSIAAREAMRRSFGRPPVKERKTVTEAWMDGGVGAISFEDACECLSMSPEVAREKILNYAEKHSWS
jgi:hypothetical protein